VQLVGGSFGRLSIHSGYTTGHSGSKMGHALDISLAMKLGTFDLGGVMSVKLGVPMALYKFHNIGTEQLAKNN